MTNVAQGKAECYICHKTLIKNCIASSYNDHSVKLSLGLYFFNYCNYDTFTTLPMYDINLSFAGLVIQKIRARHVHNSIYLSFKYADL